MDKIVEQALAHWNIAEAKAELAAQRENLVFRVYAGATQYALRLHRKGYRSDAELRSELDWMAAMAAGGLSVPAPIAAPNGNSLALIQGVQVDLLTWLPGTTLLDVMETTSAEKRARLFYELGCQMAQLHNLSDKWLRPADFDRASWNRAGLVGETPLWDRFWDNPELSPEDRKLCVNFRQRAADRLAELHDTLDQGLIHADLVPANVLVDGHTLRLIDFDDGGFGYRLFDITTALLKFRRAPDFVALQDSLLAGYHTLRRLDITHLDLFFALRAATYIGWNIQRMSEPEGHARNRRFIDTFVPLATAYLAK